VIHQVRGLVQERPDLLIAWGGDGTINEVVNGMFGSEIPLGILPGGTANLVARELRIPRKLSEAMRVIVAKHTRRISVGLANQRYFLLMVGIGFDSEVIRNVDWKLKRRFGKLAFSLSAWRTARNYDYPRFHVRANGSEEDCVFAVISNAREYGAYFVLTPEADIADEYFRVCLYKEPGLRSMTRYVWHTFRQTHLRLDSVKVLQATEVEVVGPERIAVQADGEIIGHLPLKLRVHPRSLDVFCPEITHGI
jgi:YegS/Rv2252/BmrU family lipid kinase